MKERHLVEFSDTGRKATQPPHPDFPEGLLVDLSQGSERVCRVEMPYPAVGIGTYSVTCRTCGVAVGLTTAGRADDPRTIILRCDAAPKAEAMLRLPWSPVDR